MDRIVTGTAWTTSATFYNGEQIADPSPVTATITGDDGTELDTGTATQGTDGAFTYTIPAQDNVNVLTVGWAGTSTIRTQVEVVGGYYFDLFELRQLPDVGDSSKFPPELLASARAWIEGVIDRRCGTSFVQRFRRTVLNPRSPLMLDPYATQVFSVSWGSVAADPAVLALADGLLYTTDGSAIGDQASRVTVRYSAGCMDFCPGDLKEAALAAARTHLLDQHGESSVPSRVTSTSNEFGGVTRYNLPSKDAPTGLPEVDEAIMGWADRVRVPSIA